MKESLIQKQILDYLKYNDIFHFKIIAANKNGIPDIFCLYEGQAIFLEVKTETGKTSKLQDFQMSKINENGGKSFIIKQLKDLEPIFNKG